jgi:hypothetical protein
MPPGGANSDLALRGGNRSSFSQSRSSLLFAHRSIRSRRLQDDVFASQPVLKVRPEHIDCGAVREPPVPARGRGPHADRGDASDLSDGASWDVPRELQAGPHFDMLEAILPDAKLSPYGTGRSCDAVVLLCNAMRFELSGLFHIVRRTIPEARCISHDYIRDHLYPWIEVGGRYLSDFSHALFHRVLPGIRPLCGGKVPSVSARCTVLERGRLSLALKAVRESKYSFLTSLPAGERLRELVFACHNMNASLEYMDRLCSELSQAPFLDTSRGRAVLGGLERKTWSELVASQDCAPSPARPLMRAVMTHWMTPSQMRACAWNKRCLAVPHVRKLRRSHKMLAGGHGLLPASIDTLLGSLRAEQGHLCAAMAPSREEWAEQIQLARARVRDMERMDEEDDMEEASMHGLYDFDNDPVSCSLRDVPSVRSFRSASRRLLSLGGAPSQERSVNLKNSGNVHDGADPFGDKHGPGAEQPTGRLSSHAGTVLTQTDAPASD